MMGIAIAVAIIMAAIKENDPYTIRAAISTNLRLWLLRSSRSGKGWPFSHLYFQFYF